MRDSFRHAPAAERQMPHAQVRVEIAARRGEPRGTQSFGLSTVAGLQSAINELVEHGRVARPTRAGAPAHGSRQHRQTETRKPVGGTQQKRHGAKNIARDDAGQKNGRC